MAVAASWILFFEASRHKRTVVNTYDILKFYLIWMEWKRVLEFSLPEYNWQCVTQKNNSKPEHISLMPSASPNRCFCYFMQEPLSKLYFSSGTVVLSRFLNPQNQVRLIRELEVKDLSWQVLLHFAKLDFSDDAASDFWKGYAYFSIFISSRLLHTSI